MASAPPEAAVEPLEAPQGGEGVSSPSDYEAEARSHGWTPQDEFKGDPSRWVDAETFARRADEVMPLLKKQNAELKREIADVRKLATRLSAAESKAYERAIADLEIRRETAVETGDLDAYRAIGKDIKALEKDVNADAPLADPNDVWEAMIDFRANNLWYDKSGDERAYADVMAEKYADKTTEMPPAEFFAFIAEKVIERFPDLGKAKVARRNAANPVEGVQGRTPSRGGRTFTDLPPAAQAFCDKMVKQGIVKDRAQYVASYQF